MSEVAKQTFVNLVGNTTKLTKEKATLKTKLETLTETTEANREIYKGLVREDTELCQKMKEIAFKNTILKSECDTAERELEGEKANQSSLACTVDALNNKRNILEQEVRERYGKYVAERNAQQCNMPEAFNDEGA